MISLLVAFVLTLFYLFSLEPILKLLNFQGEAFESYGIGLVILSPLFFGAVVLVTTAYLWKKQYGKITFLTILAIVVLVCLYLYFFIG